MTLQQIKQEAAALSNEDLLALQAFLLHLSRVDDPAHRADLGERMRRMDAGEKVPLDEFIRRNLSEEAA